VLAGEAVSTEGFLGLHECGVDRLGAIAEVVAVVPAVVLTGHIQRVQPSRQRHVRLQSCFARVALEPAGVRAATMKVAPGVGELPDEPSAHVLGRGDDLAQNIVVGLVRAREARQDGDRQTVDNGEVPPTEIAREIPLTGGNLCAGLEDGTTRVAATQQKALGFEVDVEPGLRRNGIELGEDDPKIGATDDHGSTPVSWSADKLARLF